MSAAEPSSPEPPGPSEPESPGPAEPEQPSKKFRFPTAFTVLALVLLLVWIASFFVPAGAYKLNKDGQPLPGTYYRLPDCSAPASEAPALEPKASPTESGQAPADAAYAPGTT